MKLQFGKFSYLLMGNALGSKNREDFRNSAYVEGLLIRDHAADLASTILKIGDHASARTNTIPFLNAVSPQVAVVSTAHERVAGEFLPNDATLSRISGILPGVTLIRTDDDEVSAGINKYNKIDGNDVFAATDGDQLVGGTSLSSPLTASVYALAGNESSTVDGSYPYAHTSSLHDVTSGSNGSCGGSYLCTGVVGYDGPTGNGTPNGTTAF